MVEEKRRRECGRRRVELLCRQEEGDLRAPSVSVVTGSDGKSERRTFPLPSAFTTSSQSFPPSNPATLCTNACPTLSTPSPKPCSSLLSACRCNCFFASLTDRAAARVFWKDGRVELEGRETRGGREGEAVVGAKGGVGAEEGGGDRGDSEGERGVDDADEGKGGGTPPSRLARFFVPLYTAYGPVPPPDGGVDEGGEAPKRGLSVDPSLEGKLRRVRRLVGREREERGVSLEVLLVGSEGEDMTTARREGGREGGGENDEGDEGVEQVLRVVQVSSRVVEECWGVSLVVSAETSDADRTNLVLSLAVLVRVRNRKSNLPIFVTHRQRRGDTRAGRVVARGERHRVFYETMEGGKLRGGKEKRRQMRGCEGGCGTAGVRRG